MIEQLFGSKTRVKLLYLFYSNPNRSFYVREITRKIDEQINSVRRELGNLLSIGIIKSDSTDNKLYYEVNQKFEHFEPLQAIFGGKPRTKLKTATAKQPVPSDVPNDLQSVGNIDLALLTGQFTRDESSGIDMLVVGNVNHNKLNKYVAELERQEGKEIRYTVFSVEDYRYREQIHDRFLDILKSAKKQVLIDKHNLMS